MSLLLRNPSPSHSVALVASLAFVVSHGCGSKVTEDTSGAGATGVGGGSAAATSGSTSNASSGASGGSDSCEKVPEYIDNLYQAAAECSPTDPSLHCQDVVDGYCCPVVVESIGSPATQAYLDFLELTKRQCPELWARCNAVDCGQPVPGNCVPDDSKAGGHCANRF